MTLKILGAKIKVKFKIGVREMVPHMDLFGYYSPDDAEIVIDQNLSKEEKLHTLLHEVIHTIVRRGGLSAAGISEGVEEVLCEQIATVFMENFSINPKR
jgi:Zn-dependent peptidase ImmA (M78 family)